MMNFDQQRTSENLKKIEYTNRIVNAIISSVERGMNRYDKIKDPACKYTILIDRLCLLIDGGTGSLLNLLEDLKPETRAKMEKTLNKLHDELNNLVDWVQNPVYSPDHPVGRELMAESKESFSKKLQKNDLKA